ncbi:MAG: homoserine kinase [Chloroflexi bacterium]|nr:homoserine kinase [Chloroflexota bacterium]
MRFTVRVPATSANLGSGFDCLGLALDLVNEFTVDTAGRPEVAIAGEGAATLPRDARNLALRTVADFFRDVGLPAPAFRLEMRNAIPLTGGLGSSSAALVGALLAANRLAGEPLDRPALLARAARLEGHPDNVAPALTGGLVVAVEIDGRVEAMPVPVPDGLAAVLFIPGFAMPTHEARRLLPRRVPHCDAAFNLSRAALWIAALQAGRLDLLRYAAEDRLHQPYRAAIFPAMPRLLAAALEAGALAAWLSGAGSALLALARGREADIAAAFESTAAASGVEGRIRTVGISRTGARVVEGEESVHRPAAAGSTAGRAPRCSATG